MAVLNFSKTSSVFEAPPVPKCTEHTSISGRTGLAGGSGKVKICPRNGPSLDSELSRSSYMGQGPLKWIQINLGQWGDHSGIHAKNV